MEKRLIEKAKTARLKAYAPYSKFLVGAAVLTSTNNIYIGCNIENSSYSLTCCAERVAIFQAIAAGEKDFQAMAIVGDTEQPITPCGACRQVINEFFNDETPIYLANLSGQIKQLTINDLLPLSFNDVHFYKS